MNSAEEILEESKAAVRLYLNSEKDRFTLILVRKATKLISSGVKLVFAVALTCVALFFFFAAIAMVWGSYLNSYPLGCVYTGLCILGVAAFVYLFTKSLISKPIMRSLLKEAFENDDENE